MKDLESKPNEVLTKSIAYPEGVGLEHLNLALATNGRNAAKRSVRVCWGFRV
jgi:hypothetical protein